MTSKKEKQTLTDEFYTIKELTIMFKTSKQHMGKLLEVHNIEKINIASNLEGERTTYRIKKSEVLKLKKALKL